MARRTETYLHLVIVALLTTHAEEVGRVLLWVRRMLFSTTSTKADEIEVGLLVLGVGFVIVTFVDMVSVARRGLTAHDAGQKAIGTALVAFVGCGFAILKATWPEGDNPKTITAEALFFWALVGWLVVGPVMFGRRYGGLAPSPKIYLFILGALLIGGVLTIVPQVAFEQAIRFFGAEVLAPIPGQPGPFSDRVSAAIVRPTSYGLLLAPWIAIAVHPTISPHRWRFSTGGARLAWLAFHGVAASGIAAAYALVFYIDRNAPVWIQQSGIEPGRVAAIFALLFLGPTLAVFLLMWAGLLFVRRDDASRWSGLALAPVVGFLSGTVAAIAAVALLLQAQTNVTGPIALAFVSTHALASGLTLLAIEMAHRWIGQGRRIGSRDRAAA